jgi:L-ascorbate metabolism protein UlaG (beta-lactamase superfamily)
MKMQLIRNATVRLSFGLACILTDPLFAQKHTMPSFAGKSRNQAVEKTAERTKIIAWHCGMI